MEGNISTVACLESYCTLLGCPGKSAVFGSYGLSVGDKHGGVSHMECQRLLIL